MLTQKFELQRIRASQPAAATDEREDATASRDEESLDRVAYLKSTLPARFFARVSENELFPKKAW